MASSAVAMASSSLIPSAQHHRLNLQPQLPWRPFLPSRLRRPLLLLPRAQSDNPLNTAPSNPSPDPVAVLDEQPPPPPPPKPRKASVLERGGTLSGEKALGKDPGSAVLGKSAWSMSPLGKFADPRWKNGTWDIQDFTTGGKVDWDAVIDAEVVRRKWLEENPESSRNDDPVVFETSTIPWWAWMKRFHLPEAELLNGRAAMVGFFLGYVIDSLTGVGLVDQTSSFLGKFLLLIVVVGVLLFRKNEDVENLKQLIKESTFYDKQWQATWQEEQPPSSKKEE